MTESHFRKARPRAGVFSPSRRSWCFQHPSCRVKTSLLVVGPKQAILEGPVRWMARRDRLGALSIAALSEVRQEVWRSIDSPSRLNTTLISSGWAWYSGSRGSYTGRRISGYSSAGTTTNSSASLNGYCSIGYGVTSWFSITDWIYR